MKRKILPLTIGVIGSLAALGLTNLPLTAQTQHNHESSATTTTQASSSKGAIQNVPRLQAKRMMTVSGDENWEDMTGFGKDSSMAEMMILMMVGGSGMEHMRMGAMKPGMKMDSPTMPGMEMGSKGLPVTVTLNPNPPIVGDNTLDVLVTDASGKPMTGLKLSATVAMTSMDMGTNRPKVVEGKDGHYAVTVAFSMKGPWRVMLTGNAPGDKKAGAVRAALDFNVGSREKWALPGGWKVLLNTQMDALKVGKNRLEFTLLDPMSKPITGAKVTSAVAMTSMDMGTAHPKAQEGKDGRYTTEVEFSMKGPWRVTLTIAPPKQKPFTQSFDFDVKNSGG